MGRAESRFATLGATCDIDLALVTFITSERTRKLRGIFIRDVRARESVENKNPDPIDRRVARHAAPREAAEIHIS